VNQQQRLKARRQRRDRRRATTRRKAAGNPVPAFEQELDSWAERAWASGAQPPPILYHYTSWDGFAGIVRTASFFCTAHGCTNDPGELQTADQAIVGAADAVLGSCGRHSKELLRRFLDGYEQARLANLFTIYLDCFSVARDKAVQWQRYADSGKGVCIGLRLLPDEHFGGESATVARALLEVNYRPTSVVPALADEYRQICGRFERLVSTHRHRKQEAMRWAWNAMYRRAALESARTKAPDWAEEEEWRHIVIAGSDSDLAVVRTERAGKFHEKVLMPMRPAGRILALAEVIIGPNQDFEASRDRAHGVLALAGYRSRDAEMPTISKSQVGEDGASTIGEVPRIAS
jgi:hypothetical protein